MQLFEMVDKLALAAEEAVSLGKSFRAEAVRLRARLRELDGTQVELRRAKADAAFLLDRVMQSDLGLSSEGILAVAYGLAVPGACALPEDAGDLARCEAVWMLLPGHRKEQHGASDQLALCRAAVGSDEEA